MMELSIESVGFSTAAVFLIFVLLHWIPFRLWSIQSRVQTLFFTWVICQPLLLLFWNFNWNLGLSEMFWGFLYALLTMVLIWFGYLQFYFSFERSPSLRFLVEILESPNGGLTAQDMRALYDFEDVFARRVQQMQEVHLIEKRKSADGEVFRNSPKGNGVGRVNQVLKDFYRLGDGG